MEYLILTSDSAEKLTERVNLALLAGWELQGGVAVDTIAVGITVTTFAQAVIMK